MKTEFARYLLDKVKQDYTAIAAEFSQTRLSLWPELQPFRKWVKDGDNVLDLGCGNGRLLELFQGVDIRYTGLDSSAQLLTIAASRCPGPKVSFVRGDVLSLPFAENSFDALYAVALLHQIPSSSLRLKVLGEAYRVLKKEGILILTVWNLWQKRYFKYILKTIFLKIFGRTELDFKDAVIPWKMKDGTVIERYYHAFTSRELRKFAQRAGFSILEAGFARRDAKRFNLYLIAKKR